ncbi:class I SAM-dependent methyltransferase [uncultured Winogradskyella sp.]|uniref:class I SAM-dependent methyltransferase n=1 Tax=Winogradskyella sp. 4-2091 TaxID=3381659 RepID=UPI00261CF396|nr:class I SAM-dependent methyltransferase [uncultured Winogradskyella sp.]
MKKALKEILPNRFVEFIKLKRQKNAFKNKPIKETFTIINESNYWRSEESVSGDGSELAVTQPLISELQLFLAKQNIKSMLDIPCGDFNWMQHTNLQNIKYIGGDIVENLIAENNFNHGNASINFSVLDLTKDSLPKVDVIFCRDCLVHLSFKEIYKALVNIKKSESKYLLTTSFYNCDSNRDIITGQWRKLNFELFPFYFKKPIYVIDEKYTMKGQKYADKTMCLWEVKDIVIPFKLKLYNWLS